MDRLSWAAILPVVVVWFVDIDRDRHLVRVLEGREIIQRLSRLFDASLEGNRTSVRLFELFTNPGQHFLDQFFVYHAANSQTGLME